MALLEEMHSKRCQVDIMSCNSIIRRAPEIATELLERLPELALQPDLFSLNAAMASVKWSEALRLMASLSEINLEPDAISFSTCISACGRAQQRSAAEQLFKEAVNRGVANEVVKNAAISASNWERALNLLFQRADELDELHGNAFRESETLSETF